jgi:hypothetical protein
MLVKIRYLARWIKFQLVYKPRYKKTPGIPCLCSNINHPFHESLREKKVCELLGNYFPLSDIKTPTQHKLSTKFDLIVDSVAVYEPHAIFSSKPDNNTYFAYYNDRRTKLDNFKEYKSLPMIVISNSTDFNQLKTALEKDPTKTSMNQLAIDLLSSHKLEELKPEYQESYLRIVNPILVIWGLIGWFFALFLFFKII